MKKRKMKKSILALGAICLVSLVLTQGSVFAENRPSGGASLGETVNDIGNGIRNGMDDIVNDAGDFMRGDDDRTNAGRVTDDDGNIANDEDGAYATDNGSGKNVQNGAADGKNMTGVNGADNGGKVAGATDTANDGFNYTGLIVGLIIAATVAAIVLLMIPWRSKKYRGVSDGKN